MKNLTRWHGHITLNFTTDYMPHNPSAAKQAIVDFIRDYGLLVGQEMVALWSLVQTLPYVYHAHILVSKMPKRYPKSNLAERGYVYDIKAVQALLMAHGCYLDNRHSPYIRNQKKIIIIDNIEHSRNAETYILTQPRLDDFGHEQTVIMSQFLRIVELSQAINSLEDSLQSQLELDSICAIDNSDNSEEFAQQACSTCGNVYPHNSTYFNWHEKDISYRSQCRLCRKLSRMATNANSSARDFERDNGKPHNSLGVLTAIDMLQKYLSQLDKNKCLRCCHTDKVVSIKDLSNDHLKTFANGGDNRLPNIGLTSRRINSTKHAKKLIDFARSQAAIGIRIKNVDIVVQQIMELE